PRRAVPPHVGRRDGHRGRRRTAARARRPPHAHELDLAAGALDRLRRRRARRTDRLRPLRRSARDQDGRRPAPAVLRRAPHRPALSAASGYQSQKSHASRSTKAAPARNSGTKPSTSLSRLGNALSPDTYLTVSESWSSAAP